MERLSFAFFGAALAFFAIFRGFGFFAGSSLLLAVFRFLVAGSSTCDMSSSDPRFLPDRSTMLMNVIGGCLFEWWL